MTRSQQKGHPDQLKHQAEMEQRRDELTTILCQYCTTHNLSKQTFQRDLKNARVATEAQLYVKVEKPPAKKAKVSHNGKVSNSTNVMTNVMEFEGVCGKDPDFWKELFDSVQKSVKTFKQSGEAPKNTDCIETANREGGRPRLNFTSRKKEKWTEAGGSSRGSLYFSHIVLCQSRAFPTNIGDEGSHICNNAQCVNIDHLRWESGKIQKQRQQCVARGHCDGNHDGHPRCLHL